MFSSIVTEQWIPAPWMLDAWPPKSRTLESLSTRRTTSSIFLSSNRLLSVTSPYSAERDS